MNLLQDQLDSLCEKKLLRTLSPFSPTGGVLRGKFKNRPVINFSSNSYLGLDNDRELKNKLIEAVEKTTISSEASRLITGTGKKMLSFEKKLASWKKTEAALVFNSGYMANVGIIPALSDRHTDIFADKLSHASIIDGAHLSRASFRRFRHLDVKHLEKLLKSSSASRKIVVTDSIFSMDGNIAPLNDMKNICKKHNAFFIVDEAHATGVRGPEGRGLCSEEGISGPEIIQMGTFSKAMGLMGAYAAASETVIRYLVNKARSFIFTTALPPYMPYVMEKSVEIVRSSRGEKMRSILQKHIEKLKSCGFYSGTHIVPLKQNSTSKTMEKHRELLEKGILGLPIRPPTVPHGTSRIRISLSAGHTENEVNKLCKTLS
ncbi:MAG: 8-amino-7-oxononanoate synthase [bacterium]